MCPNSNVPEITSSLSRESPLDDIKSNIKHKFISAPISCPLSLSQPPCLAPPPPSLSLSACNQIEHDGYGENSAVSSPFFSFVGSCCRGYMVR